MKFCLAFLLLLACQAQSPREHDLIVARRPLMLGGWSEHVSVRGELVENWLIYRSASQPSHTCWTSLWSVPGGRDIMLSFVSMTGPVNGPALSARDRMVFWERFGRRQGQWYIDNGYTAKGRKTEILTLRSSDLGKAWKVLSTYPYPGVIGILDDPQTVMLPNGTAVRTRYGNLVDDPELPPDAALSQLSHDSCLTWTRPVPMLDRSRYFSIPIRPYLLRDGRIAAIVSYYRKTHRDETAWRPQWTSTGLLLSSDGGQSWSHDPIPVLPSDGGFLAGNESALVELPSGDLLFEHRRIGTQLRGDETTVYQGNRLQTLMWRDGTDFRAGRAEDSPVPHGAKPELLYLRNDLVLSVGRGGIWWTANAGRTWRELDLGASVTLPMMHQPECLQVADGSIVCVYHVGTDNAYGKADQSIRAVRLRVEKVTEVTQDKTGPGESVALYGRPEDSDITIEAALDLPVRDAEVGLLVRASPGGGGSVRTLMGYLLRIGGSGAVAPVNRRANTVTLGFESHEFHSLELDEMFACPRTVSLTPVSLFTRELLTVTDTTFPYGATGLYTRNAPVRFVNPRIRASRM